MYYCHFLGYLRGAVQGYHASTNFPESMTPHITPSQQEVATRQEAPPVPLYVCVYMHIYVYMCMHDIYTIKEPVMLEFRETLKQCKYWNCWNVKKTTCIPA
jgi:hypothetical protein